MNSTNSVFHVLHNPGGRIVFAQQDGWGENAIRMHELINGEISPLPRHRDIWYGFWDPANPKKLLPEGYIVLFVQAESLIEATCKTGTALWEYEAHELHALRKGKSGIYSSFLPEVYHVHNSSMVPKTQKSALPNVSLPPRSKQDIKESGSFQKRGVQQSFFKKTIKGV